MSTESQDVGSTLRGGYRVIDVLKGGMGVVYICHQDSTNQLYALKTVRFDGQPEQTQRLEERFQVEVNHWIHISREKPCEQVVTALAFDADERLLILEFVDGLPLHVLASADIPVHPQHALAWARDIAVGMRLLHADFRLVHRDLKPQNILISRKNLVAKITDLGIGKVLRDDAATGTLVGTPAFMPPESFEGRADFRSDIYAFGATLFWMLTGEHAVAQNGPLESTLPERTRELISRCLQADPERRFQEFEDLTNEFYEVDPVESFEVDESRYLWCERHHFHSPRFPGNEDRCLFCRQEEELARQMTVSMERAKEKKAKAEATSFLMDDLVSDGVAGAADAGAPVAAGAAVGERAPRRLPAPAQRSWATLVGAVLVVVVVGAALGIYLGRDPAPPGPQPGRTPAPPRATPVIESGAKCTVEGCEQPVARIPEKWLERHEREGDALHQWTPDRCPEHSPWVCTGCGARSEFQLSVDFPCVSCGESTSKRE